MSDASTIEKTKQQIRGLVQEIAQLSRGDMEPEQYYGEVMQRIVTALAAVGGAVWTIDSERRLRLEYQVNISRDLLNVESDDSRRHVRLLQEVFRDGQSRLVTPMSGGGEPDSPGNPTNTLLVLSPMKSDDSVEGLIEVFQRPDAQPASHQGYLRFLDQMSELVGDWMKSRKLKTFSDRQSFWAKIDQFAKEVHESLDVSETCYTIANESRRLIGCDRVSVTVTNGPKQVVKAISGQDTMDTRSNIVTLLSALTTRVCATGEPLWYSGSMQDLPPQVEKTLEAYVDESHTKSIAIVPLKRVDVFKQKPSEELGQEEQAKFQLTQGDVIGALIVEHIDSTQPQSMVAPKVEEVCEHSARAIGNALEHNSLFLMPVWKAIGHSRWALTAKNLPKTMLISGAILAALLALFILRKDFILKAEGILTPVEKKDVFFEQDGRVSKVLVDHGDTVTKGQVIVELENKDLEKEIQQLYTDLGEAQASQRQVQLSRDPESESKLAELRARIHGYTRQLELLEEKQSNLIVRAPMDGQVVTWDIRRLLEHRPVMRGQKALQLANPNGEWQLEVFLPEKRIGHLTKAQKDSGEPLDVSYVLKSNPGSSPLDAKLSEVQRTATFHDEHGQSFRLRVNQIDKDKLLAALKKGDTPGELKQGTEVLARVHCGRANLAFCFFHELVEWAYLQLYSI